MSNLSIYIADDHPIVVEGLKEILRSRPEWTVTGTANNGRELLELMSARNADVVIADINMPEKNGIQCTEWIKKNYPLTRVIILTMYPEKSYLTELVKAGADGCLLKNRGSLELLDAIERVIDGKSYFDSISDFADNSHQRDFKLSEREIEIIRMVAAGDTSAEIAGKLFISEHTVKTHRKNILKKTGAGSTGELMTFAINNKLLG